MKNVLIVLLALVIGSCKQNTEPEIKTAPSQSEVKTEIASSRDLNETEESVAVTFDSEVATAVHGAYLDLKAAFVNTDAVKAAEVASEFQQMIEGVSEDKALTGLKADLELIKKSTDVSQQRIAFENVSKSVESYLSDKVGTGTLIKQYCPMAFDGKGAYWLSDSKEVRNPYYGDKMLKCGVVDKEIK